jgi:uncharacterized protein YdaU (DUF1376 family)
MSQEEIQTQVATQLAAELQKLNDEFDKRKAEAEAAELRREEAAQKRQEKATQDLIKFFSDQSAQAAKDRADADLLRTAAQQAKDTATEKEIEDLKQRVAGSETQLNTDAINRRVKQKGLETPSKVYKGNMRFSSEYHDADVMSKSAAPRCLRAKPDLNWYPFPYKTRP